MAEIIIENIVATTQLAKKFDIKHLSNTIQDSKYDAKEFSGLTLHFNKPKTVSLVFPSGIIVCTGAKNMDEIKELISKTIDKIKDTGTSVAEKPEVEIHNIVVSSDLNKELNLANMSKNPLLGNLEYKPEKLPGIVCRLDDPDAVLLIFSSGKIVCTGVKKIEDASRAIETIENRLTSMGVL